MPAKNSSFDGPFFSVIVPIYNVQQYVRQCIDSVLRQSFQDFELILVDDGSTDQGGEICQEYIDKGEKRGPKPSIVSQNSKKVNSGRSKTYYFYQKNAGLSAARNTGIKHARGEYLIFLDGDDYLTEGALESIKNGIEPGLDLLRYQAEEVFGDGRIMKYGEEGFSTIPGVEAFPKLAHYHYTENAWLYAYRREFFIQNDFRYAEGCIAEDFGLTPLVIAKAKSVKSISDICYNYRQREGSIMHDPAKLAQRTADIGRQLEKILPRIAEVHGSEAILHYLVVSFLTAATEQGWPEFLKVYQKAKKVGMLKYIRPASLRAMPRSLLLWRSPKLFYRVYHR